MRRWCLAAATLAVVLGVSTSEAVAARAGDELQVYSATVQGAQLGALDEKGIDVSVRAQRRNGVSIQLILTDQQRAALAADGIATKLTRVQGGQTVKQFAAKQAANGFTVWRSYDEPGGIRDQLYDVARQNPDIAKLVRIGTTLQGREILALKLTKNARQMRDGKRPAVLYSATQHAREWIAAEVDRRLMRHVVDRYRANDKEMRKLLDKTELWFVLVANPDGYQYTFDAERLWRKNLRDNDGDGQITISDGVDPNRNFPNHFGYDEEGSSSIFSSQTYRGPSAVSEAETSAMKGLLDRIGFAFQVNWHSAGEWLLYAEGWQVGTPTADDPIYFALSGNLDEPAIPGFHPGLSSDVLYVTNGETTDYAHATHRRARVDAGARRGLRRLRLRLPGRPGARAGRVRADAAVLDVGREVGRGPGRPGVVARHRDQAVLPEERRPVQGRQPGRELRLRLLLRRSAAGRGARQAQPRQGDAEVPDQRRAGAQRVRRRSGRAASATTPRPSTTAQMRGVVRGTDPGDSVKVWFEAKGDDERLVHLPGGLRVRGTRCSSWPRRTTPGASPVADAAGRTTSQYYLDALAANGIGADVYDVDARNRTAPDHLGVLSHYDGVIWYTGDDIVTRKAGWGGGNADRLALDESLEFRAYMNEGGRVLYTGKRAGQQFSGAGVGTQLYDPKDEGPCNPPDPTWDPRRCLLLRGSIFGGDLVNDTLEYWFGGFVQVADDGIDEDGSVFGMLGVDDPFTGLSWDFNGPDSADNQDSNSSFVVDERDPAAGPVPAVRELAVVAVGQAGRPVRAAHRRRSTPTPRSPTCPTSA